MRTVLISVSALALALGCTVAKSDNSATGGSAGVSGSGGAGGSVGGAGGSGGSGGAPVGYSTCMDLLSCIADCPETDANCPDACYSAGAAPAQSQLLALLTCMDDKKCEDVTCTEAQCPTELVTCLESSTTGGGTPNPDGGVPTGAIPAELVGYWVQPGWSDVSDFTFAAGGSAIHTKYKESSVGSCSMSVNSEWKTGSVAAKGDELTVTLAEGVTAVAWIGGCGTGYTNAAPGKVLNFKYALDLAGDKPGIWLTDLACTGENCKAFYQKK
jgi:hypothetical protein